MINNKDYISKKYSRSEIAYWARFVRKKFNLEFVCDINIIDILENKMFEHLKNYNYEIIPYKNMYGIEAYTVPDKNTIYIREDVYLNASNNIPHYRFTLAHELFHCLFHSILKLYKIEKNTNISYYEIPEIQADMFAGEFLAPSYLIQNMTIEEIQNNFSVSYTCAKIQYQNSILDQ